MTYKKITSIVVYRDEYDLTNTVILMGNDPKVNIIGRIEMNHELIAP